MYKIDNVDTEILHLLKEDGRVPYAAIAKKVGLTSTAVSQRIQKMVDEGMIEGFGVKLKLEKLGIGIQAMITLKMSFSRVEAINKILKTYAEIEYAYRITGEDCIMMKANLRDNAHLLEFINKLSIYGLTKTSIIIEQVI